MNKLITGLVVLMATSAYADLGINFPVVTDSVNEYNAKQGASNLGITQIYDAPTQAPNGEFYVPVGYNRPGDPGAGQQDVNSPANTTDIDYIPLSQLKGAQGVAGTAGAIGSTGAQGTKGTDGKNGKDGLNGRDGKDADIDNTLTVNLGVAVRWYDWKYVSLNSGYKYDVNHGGHTVDAAIIQIKLGRSYEQRELDKIKKFLGVK